MLLNNLSIYENILINQRLPGSTNLLIEEKLNDTDRLYSSSPIIFDNSNETYSVEENYALDKV